MTSDGTVLARELAEKWKGYLENVDDPEQEYLAEFIDVVDTLETDVKPDDLRSGLRLVNHLNEALSFGLEPPDHQIVLDALNASLRELGGRVGVEVPVVQLR